LESKEEKKEAVVRVRAREPKERGTRLPDGWMPSLETWAFVLTLLHPDEATRERESFRDYWLACGTEGRQKGFGRGIPFLVPENIGTEQHKQRRTC
jgi:hypothetical protein